jgi:hypothetical protein
MILSQGRKTFLSLEEAKKQIKPDGERVSVIGDARAVTIRSEIVRSFPGTIEQLYDLGIKLGGYPLDFFKSNRKQCEELDAAKELVMARAIAFMEWQWEHQHPRIIEDISMSLRTVIEKNGLLQEADKHGTISDFLLSFRLDAFDKDSKAVKATGMELMEDNIRYQIGQIIGLKLSAHLQATMPKELGMWINDEFNECFVEKWDVEQHQAHSNEELYRVILQHPDIRNLRDDFMERVRGEFYRLSPAVVLLEQRSKNTNRVAGSEEPVTEIYKPSDIIKSLSQEHIQALLTLYFAKFNPLKLISEAMIFTSFTEYLADNNAVEVPEEIKKHMASIASELGDLQELENIFSKHPLFTAQLVSDMMFGAGDENGFSFGFGTSDIDVQPEFNPYGPQYEGEEKEEGHKLAFGHHILRNPELSWREKGMLAYSYFMGDIDLDIDDLTNLGPHSKQTIRKSLKQLEEIGAAKKCGNCDILHMNIDFLGERCIFVFNPYEPFEDFLTNDELSWEAKGVYCWFKIIGSTNQEALEAFSKDRLSSLVKAFEELSDGNMILSQLEVEQLREIVDDEMAEQMEITKETFVDWYEESLKPILKQIINMPKLNADVLNARYPAFDNYSAVQLATIAGDIEMVEALLKVEGIELYEEYRDVTHPLHLAYVYDAENMIPLLMKFPQISTNEEDVGSFVLRIILEGAPVSMLKATMQHLESVYKQPMLDRMMNVAIVEATVDHVMTLLELGASPNTVVFKGRSALELTKENGMLDLYRLLKKFAS